MNNILRHVVTQKERFVTAPTPSSRCHWCYAQSIVAVIHRSRRTTTRIYTRQTGRRNGKVQKSTTFSSKANKPGSWAVGLPTFDLISFTSFRKHLGSLAVIWAALQGVEMQVLEHEGNVADISGANRTPSNFICGTILQYAPCLTQNTRKLDAGTDSGGSACLPYASRCTKIVMHNS